MRGGKVLERFGLAGRKALVTGASRGIGRAVAVAFAEAGADVALAARDVEALKRVAEEVEGHGRSAVVIDCDLADAAQAEAMVKTAVDGLGGLDVLVNNAGVMRCVGPFTDLDEADWAATLGVNVGGAVATCRAAAPHLKEGGAVVNVASIMGLGGMPFAASYAVSKAALISLSQALAMEWAAHGVRVNALAPGWTHTAKTDAVSGDPAAFDVAVASVPAGRWADPDDIAAAALFLASDAASYITGQCLAVDGGWSVDLAGPGLRGMLASLGGRTPVGDA
ncbi:SDR family NAD(P)-dependent oxidoreductase [Actinocorallia sp. A-T 12471]|uniref:SDR family NAD(P)-dependent oxidoreductase n=1 Tax=Actinocorallia sp. A-T 12471 TaxID=3089813 RepID=UPI0029D05F81|nr:SDR family NAD(P)-dependent oxidoreductase [Actinocorallia sp. A-T 12471]MDX6740240.1 SDR family NAD(P)-dependent oxidoreductase [Actinocorallia sp. A-T 12471]